MNHLVCPTCRLSMNNITFREFCLALCPRCEGSFSTEETVHGLLRQPDLRMSTLRPTLLPNLVCPHPPEEQRARIPCPVCGETLSREAFSAKNPMKVDRCPQGHGIWLDDGELGLLLNEQETNDPIPEPGFWEGLRRLVGLKPRVAEPESP